MKTFMEALKEFDELQSNNNIRISRKVKYEVNTKDKDGNLQKVPLETILQNDLITGIKLTRYGGGYSSDFYVIHIYTLNGIYHDLYEFNHYNDTSCNQVTVENSKKLYDMAKDFVDWVNNEYLVSTIKDYESIRNLGKSFNFNNYIYNPEKYGLKPGHKYYFNWDSHFTTVVDADDRNVLYIFKYIGFHTDILQLLFPTREPAYSVILGENVKVIIAENAGYDINGVVEYLNNEFNTSFEITGPDTIKNCLYDTVKNYMR